MDKVIRYLAVVLVSLLACLPAYAGGSKTDLNTGTQAKQELKEEPKSQITQESKLKGGMAFRIRNEYWKNWKDMDNDQLDNRNFFRIKSSLWGQAGVNENLIFYTKLTNEFRAHTYFGGTSGSFPDKTASKKGYHFDINEVVFDNFYMDAKNLFGLPLDIRLGRQDFLGAYGEGFLIMDGTPQDGSRTFYFNAAKMSLRANEENTFDFIYINDPRDEEILPVINRTKLVKASDPTSDKIPQLLNTTDEQGFVLYWKNKSLKKLLLENYYIFKLEAEEGGSGYQAQKGKLNTFGTFAKYDLSPWTIRGQLAYQFGHYGNNDRRAIGGYAYVDKDFKDVLWSPQVSLGYSYLSGDKLGSSKNEVWDPLFSRYPWISELYVNSISAETGIPGYWTNLSSYGTSLTLRPTKKLKLSLWYYYLRANAQVASSTIFSGTGKSRGQMPQVRLDYTFNKNFSSYVLAEYLFPGSFYKDRDPALFLRTELMIKF
jgi:hypothetical protein